jgi:hypothetical protein
MAASLERTLATVLRRGLEPHALACAGAADRALLENIALLAQQTVPEVNLTAADVSKQGEVYTLRMPASTPELRVSLAQLRDIESYSPFRIVDICVRGGGEHASVVVQVATEARAIVFSETDIVRIKRRRT